MVVQMNGYIPVLIFKYHIINDIGHDERIINKKESVIIREIMLWYYRR